MSVGMDHVVGADVEPIALDCLHGLDGDTRLDGDTVTLEGVSHEGGDGASNPG